MGHDSNSLLRVQTLIAMCCWLSVSICCKTDRQHYLGATKTIEVGQNIRKFDFENLPNVVSVCVAAEFLSRKAKLVKKEALFEKK
jgi:hypothetical protein